MKDIFGYVLFILMFFICMLPGLIRALMMGY